jgi:hypothetical protein
MGFTMSYYARNTGGAWLADWLAVGLAGRELMARIANAITNYAREWKHEEYAKKIVIYQHAVNEYTIKIMELCLISVQKRLDKFMSRHFDQKCTTVVMFFFR